MNLSKGLVLTLNTSPWWWSPHKEKFESKWEGVTLEAVDLTRIDTDFSWFEKKPPHALCLHFPNILGWNFLK